MCTPNGIYRNICICASQDSAQCSGVARLTVEEETAGSKIFEDEIMVVHVVDMSTVTETEIGKRKLKKMKSIFVTLGSFIALH